VKIAFFTEFVLTLQTDFAARWCCWFSANDSSNEQFCPPLVYGFKTKNTQLAFPYPFLIFHFASTSSTQYPCNHPNTFTCRAFCMNRWGYACVWMSC